MSDLNLVYSPQYYNFVANSSDVVFDNIFITGYSKSEHVAKNTDGWDTYRSDHITIQNSVVNNGDGKICQRLTLGLSDTFSRLRLVQVKQYERHCPEHALQREPWHFCWKSWAISGPSRLRREPLDL